jgi:hypothetical protein
MSKKKVKQITIFRNVLISLKKKNFARLTLIHSLMSNNKVTLTNNSSTVLIGLEQNFAKPKLKHSMTSKNKITWMSVSNTYRKSSFVVTTSINFKGSILTYGFSDARISSVKMHN